MGVTIEVWRARCGSFHAGKFRSSTSLRFSKLNFHDGFVQKAAAIAVLAILLVIGNIELNPGPVFNCFMCGKVYDSAEENVLHQQLHMLDSSFTFRCPFSCCLNLRFKNFRDVTAHLSLLHKPIPESQVEFLCQADNCSFSVSSSKELASHVINMHLSKGENMFCIFGNCEHKSRPFSKPTTYRCHLSQYHPYWNKPPQSAQVSSESVPESVPIENMVGVDDGCHDNVVDMDVDIEAPPVTRSVFEDDDVAVKFIARFYLMLQGFKNIPASTVQEICEYLACVSEVVQARLKSHLKTSLTKFNISEEEQTAFFYDLQCKDPLFSTHHTYMPGPNLTTEYYRDQFYRNYFGYRDPLEIGLSIDKASNLKVQYNPVSNVLQEMLQDKSVKKQVDESFLRVSSSNGMLNDYYDGTVMKERNEKLGSKEVIDLIVFQDAFGVTCPIGSAKSKFKILATYLNLGNLKPYIRSKLKSMRLVLLFREKILNTIQATHEAIAGRGGEVLDRAYSQKQCFGAFLSDLRSLIQNGIFYGGRYVTVRLTHVLGDNLGSHFIGGFLQYFTAGHICRFCSMTLEQFRAECKKGSSEFVKCLRTKADYHRCALKAKLLNLKHVKGVKFISILEDLGDFNVCDGLPPCLAHDYFEGVASEDLFLILKDLVQKKWFTFDYLNKKISKFHFFGEDVTNKPAPINDNKKKGRRQKLGGHAVQNWTLIRFLSYLIQDKIKDVEDPTWQFYLCMKELCEHICSPSFAISDLNYMKHCLIPRYMEMRVNLFGAESLLPKHHFICHYPDLILKYGPIFYLWTLRFESFHSYFKTVARHNNNFINVERSLALKHQLRMCYFSSGELFDEGVVFSSSECTTTDLAALTSQEASILEPFLSNTALFVPNISVEGLKYKIGDFLLLNQQPENLSCLVLGKIQRILYTGTRTVFVMKKVQSVSKPMYGVYLFEESLENNIICEELSLLKHPRVTPVYDFKGTESFTLKHMICRDQ